MTADVPLPTPPPEPAEARPSLSAEINRATRKHHTELNRLIIERLPLALPPHATQPDVLGQGLASFAHIFFAFEQVWKTIEDGQHALSKYDPDKSHEYDVVGSLAFLRPSGLARSQALRADLQAIIKRTRQYVTTRAVGRELGNRVKAQVDAKPHLLITYAWVMYMAIFSGGRWIRQQLAQAGGDFWVGSDIPNWPTLPDNELDDSPEVQEEKRSDPPGFSFLYFPESGEDGEDIKAEFKSRLAESEALLTDEERAEVVEAAQGLFDDCIGLVRELDEAVAKQKMSSIILPAVVLTLLLVFMTGLYLFDKHGYLRG